MRKTTRSLIAGGAVTAALLTLSACAPEPEPEPELLTVSAAGARYLDAVCPVNEAWDAVDLEMDRLRIAVSRPEPADTSLFAAAMQGLGDASGKAAARLSDQTIVWPSAAEPAIALVRDSLEKDEAQAKEVAELPAVEIVEYAWRGAGELGAAAASARESLGLPEDPIVACEAKDAARDEAKDAAQEDAKDGA